MVTGGQIKAPTDVSDEEVIQRWNDAAEDYSSFFSQGDEYFHQYLINPVLLDMLGPIRGKRVLDVGCGEGHFSRHMAELAKGAISITAVDISERMIAQARRRSTPFTDSIRFLVGNASNLPGLSDASFDLVVSNMSLMDVKDYAAAIVETARLLRPDGVFVFAILHPCFQVPGSGWVSEHEDGPEGTKRTTWRVCNYFLRLAYVGRAKESISHQTCYFHRTLGDYSAALRKNGFMIADLREPPPTPELLSQHGEHLVHASLFLLAKCVRTS